MGDTDRSDRAIYLNSSTIAVALYDLHAEDGACPQEAEHGLLIIWRPIPYCERDTRFSIWAAACGRFTPQSTRWPTEERVKHLIEPTQAAKSRRQCDFGHGHFCFVDKVFRKQHTSSLGHGNRRSSEVLKE